MNILLKENVRGASPFRFFNKLNYASEYNVSGGDTNC